MSELLRPDLAAIAAMIPERAHVLDVGCGDGALLEYLIATKRIDGRGLELDQQNVNACVTRGLAVIQGDADADLVEYPSNVFDVVILSQTIQATRNPKSVLGHLLRIGGHVAISLPNFGNWRVRLDLLAHGRMPHTRLLNYEWYDTPNIHLCTIADFVALAAECGSEVEKAFAIRESGRADPMRADAWGPNLFAEAAVFLLKKRRNG
jgi:methionine biosynthesis protein MetW